MKFNSFKFNPKHLVSIYKEGGYATVKYTKQVDKFDVTHARNSGTFSHESLLRNSNCLRSSNRRGHFYLYPEFRKRNFTAFNARHFCRWSSRLRFRSEASHQDVGGRGCRECNLSHVSCVTVLCPKGCHVDVHVTSGTRNKENGYIFHERLGDALPRAVLDGLVEVWLYLGVMIRRSFT